MKADQTNRILFVGGIDSSGAAGLAADLRAAHAFNVDAATVTTAVTVQSTAVCHAVNPVDADVVAGQLAAATADVIPGVIKTGLLATAAQVRAVADHVRRWRQDGHAVDLIVDPVVSASSGLPFCHGETWTALVDELLPLADLLTPNAEEAGLLQPAHHPRLTLFKGGHIHPDGSGSEPSRVDDILIDGNTRWRLSAPRLPGDWRGTGCALAAAVAANRARGECWLDAIVAGRAWLQAAIKRGTTPTSGPGRIPFTAWRDVVADDVPDLSDDAPQPPPFRRLAASIGVYPIIDRATWMQTLIDHGVRTIQLRVKDLQGAALRLELQTAHTLAQRFGVQLFINDHWREALELGAYGVHLGQEDLDAADLTAIQAAGLRLGISTHSLAEAARAKTLSPSYIALGPIRPTTCKSMRFGPQGFGRLAEWHRLFDVPLVAIGGLTLADVDRVRASGCDGIAAVSAILGAPAPGPHAAEWLHAWGNRDAAVYR